MLSSSSHAKLLSSIRLDQALLPTAIPTADRAFLLQLVDYLYSQKEKYQLCTTGMFTIDDEATENQEKAIMGTKLT